MRVELQEGKVAGESRRLASFHAGPITGLGVSALTDHAVGSHPNISTLTGCS